MKHKNRVNPYMENIIKNYISKIKFWNIGKN